MTYADNYSLRTANANFNRVASAVDGLLVTVQQTLQTSSLSATAGAASMTGAAAAVTVASGQYVVVYAQASYSHSVTDTYTDFYVTRNGTQVSNTITLYSAAGRTNGGDLQAPIFFVDTSPVVGVNTYQLVWNPNASTAYSFRQQVTAIVFRAS